MHRINHPFASEPSGGVSLLLSYHASEETSERVRALQHSSGGRGLTGEKRNGSREDSHTRSVRWPAPLRASALKEHISLKEYTGDRVFLKMSYHPCVSGAVDLWRLRTVTITASRVWAFSTLRKLSWMVHVLLVGT